jgi:hypothetical protein
MQRQANRFFLSATANLPSPISYLLPATSPLRQKSADFAVIDSNIACGKGNVPVNNGKFTVANRKFEQKNKDNSCYRQDISIAKRQC